MGFVSVRSDKTVRYDLRNDLPIVMFADLAIWADHVRKQALAPAAEYVLDVEIRVLGGNVQVNRDGWYDSSGTLQLGSTKFPRYSLDDPDEIPTLLALFERDFWNSFGKDISAEQPSTLVIR